MANTFATWQTLISDPALPRELASQVIVFEFGMIIYGTFFGTKEAYDALGFEQKLTVNATSVTVTVLDWLGTVANWAQNELLNIAGGIVCVILLPRMCLTLKRHHPSTPSRLLLVAITFFQVY